MNQAMRWVLYFFTLVTGSICCAMDIEHGAEVASLCGDSTIVDQSCSICGGGSVTQDCAYFYVGEPRIAHVHCYRQIVENGYDKIIRASLQMPVLECNTLEIIAADVNLSIKHKIGERRFSDLLRTKVGRNELRAYYACCANLITQGHSSGFLDLLDQEPLAPTGMKRCWLNIKRVFRSRKK